MKLLQWIKENLYRRRRRRPARQPRFADRFAAELVIKPLESRLVLSGTPTDDLILALSGGNLHVTDVSADHANSITIQANANTDQYVINDSTRLLNVSGIDGATLSQDRHTAFVPFASVGDQIIANTGGGDDLLTIDFTLGGFADEIKYLGGEGDDALAITGFGVIATYTPGNVTGSGSISIGGTSIGFSGLQPVSFASLAPIDFNVAGGSFTLDLTGMTTDEVTIEECTLVSDPTKAALKVSGSVDDVEFENVRVRGSSITIETHGGDDIVTVLATGSDHLNTDLAIDTGTDAGDSIVIDGEAEFTGTVALHAPHIELNANIIGDIEGSASTVNVSTDAQIQDAIDLAAYDAVITMASGEYFEDLAIDRPLALLGAYAGENPAATMRELDLESVIDGSISIDTPGTVTIDGFRISDSITDPGSDLVIENNIILATNDAIDITGANSALIRNNQIESTNGSGIVGADVVKFVTITNNSIEAALLGIDLAAIGGVTTVQGNLIIAGGTGLRLNDTDDEVHIGGFGKGEQNIIEAGEAGVELLVVDGMGPAFVENNQITAVTDGIVFTDGDSDFTARGNEIRTELGTGILISGATGGQILIGGSTEAELNLITAKTFYGVSITNISNADVTIEGNDITASNYAVNADTIDGSLTIRGNVNIASDSTDIYAAHVTGEVNILDNILSGTATFGMDLLDVGSDGSQVLIDGNNVLVGPILGILIGDAPNAVIQNNTLTETTQGISLYSGGVATSVTLAGNAINSNAVGTGIVIDGLSGLITVAFEAGNTVTGGVTGLSIDGAGVSLFDNTLGDLVLLLGTTGDDYITLATSALDDVTIDATAVLFDSDTGSDLSVSQNFDLEDRIIHAIDDGDVGFIQVKTDSLFVTRASGSIQRAIDAAANDGNPVTDTIHIQESLSTTYTGGADSVADPKDVKLSPGGSPAQVDINGHFSIDAGDTLVVEVNGANPGSEHDKFVVAGMVSLSGATLDISGTIMAPFTTDIVLIDNDGSLDAVGGTFDGLAEGAAVTINDVEFRITYQGGDGNDVVLGAIVAETSVTLDLGGNLVITDIEGGVSDDTLTIQVDVDNQQFIISDPNLILTTDINDATGDFTNTVIVPFDEVAGTIIFVNTLGGNDNLTLDYSLDTSVAGGNLVVTYNAGAGSDSLALTGNNTAFDAVDHTFVDASTGTVEIVGDAQITQVIYDDPDSEFGPIRDSLRALDRSFTFSLANDAIEFQDAPDDPGIDLDSIESDFSSLVVFRDPTSLLTINAGDGTDAVIVGDPDSDYRAALTILGQDGIDTISQISNLTLGSVTSTGNLLYDAEGIQLDGDLLSTGGSAIYNGAVTLISDTWVDTDTGDVTFQSTLDSVTGENNALFVNTAGVTRFNGLVGTSDRLASLATDLGGTTVINTSQVNTSGGQTYGDAVLLDFSSVTLDSSAAGPITFEQTLDSGPAENNSLTVNTAGTTRFSAAVGATTPLASLTTDAAGTTAIHGQSIITAGAQTYHDSVTLGADAQLTASLVTFNGTVTGNTHDLEVIGDAILGDADTDIVSGLGALTIGGTTTINTHTVASSGPQTYSDAVTIGAPAITATLSTTNSAVLFGSTLALLSHLTVSSGTGHITFSGPVNGGFALGAHSSGTTQFLAAVGNSMPLASLTTDALGTTALAGPSIAAAIVNFQDAVRIEAPSLDVSGPTSVTFQGSVSGAVGSEDLHVVSSGQVTFQAAVLDLSDLSVNATGTTTFGGAVTLADTLLVRSGSHISVNGAITAQGTATPIDLAAGFGTGTGNVTLSAAGSLLATAPGSHIRVVAGATSGHILLVGAASNITAADTITLTAAGGQITGLGTLTAPSLDLDALAGIHDGGLGGLKTSAQLVAADNTGPAAVHLANASSLAVNVTSLTTVGGSLTFAQTLGGALTFSGAVTSGNATTNGGHILLTNALGGDLTVAATATLSSASGSGGLLSISGATVNATPVLGAGHITIQGGAQDTIIGANLLTGATISLSALRDVIIRASVTASGASSDLVIEADTDNDGTGGVWLDEAPLLTDARLAAGRDVLVQGSDLFATPASADSLRIDNDLTNLQVLAARHISLTGKTTTAADIVIDGRQTATAGSITVDASRSILLCADQVAGLDIVFQDAVLLTDDLLLTAGRDVTFEKTLDDDGEALTPANLTITAGGDVAFYGNIGAAQALSSLTVTGAAGVILGDADGGTPVAAAITTVRTSGAIDIGSAGPIGSRGILFDGGASLLTVSTSSGSVRLNGAVRLDSHLAIDTDQSDADDLTTSLTGASILLTHDAPIDSQANSANTATEANQLTLDAGHGSLRFNEDLGQRTHGQLGRLIVEEADGGVVFGQADDESGPDTGPVNFVTLVGDGSTANALDLGSLDTISGGIGLNGGTGTLTISTSSDAARFNGPVTLSTDVRIDTGSGSGDITFTSASTIDSQAAEHNDLVLSAGIGRVFFSASIGTGTSGGSQCLGMLTIETAVGGVTFGVADVAVTGGVGPVTSVFTDGAIDIGANNTIGGTGIVFNAAGGNLTIQTSDDNVRLNGAVHLQGHLRIDTDEGAAGSSVLSTAGNITFTSDAPINSQDGTLAAPLSTTAERNNLVIDAGDRQVSFNANIGSTQRLNLLTVERAGSGVVFGAADLAVTGGFGPLTTIQTDGAMDIGAGTNADNVIGGAGIVFNAAGGDFTVQTSDDDVRLNGAVRLQSHLRIDTSASVGGDITFTKDATIDSQDGTLAAPLSTTAERNNLVIDAGERQVSFNANIGATQRLNLLSVERAGSGVVFGAADLAVTGGFGPLTAIQTDGAIDIGAHNTIGGTGIVFNAGAGNLTIQTSDDDVRLNGAVWLQGHLRIDTDEGAAGSPSLSTTGNVTFTSDAPINSQNGTVSSTTGVGLERNNLVIDAGDRQVSFNANLGTTQRLNLLSVERAGSGVVFGAADVATIGSFGQVTSVFTDGAIDIGAGTNADNVIGGAGIVFNAAGGDFTVQTSDDDVRLSGAVWLQSHLLIDTDEGAAGSPSLSTAGNITFTSDAPINSQNGTVASTTSVGLERNNLVIDAGDRQVSFNANIGVTQRLNLLTVERAGSGAVFGAADVATTGDFGPLTTIQTDGAIDIGAGTNADNVIGGAGIVFNAASGDFTVQTSDDDVRLNGTVWLQGHLRIDTDEGAAGSPSFGITGNITFTSDAPISSQNGTVASTTGVGLERNNLVIDAGDRQVSFNANIGATQRLNLLTVERADGGVTFGAGDAVVTGGQGPVTSVFADGAIDIGAHNTIGGTGIVFNAGAGNLTIQTSDDDVRLNGAVWLQGHLRIDTDGGAAGSPSPGTNGNVTFTSDAPINSQNGTVATSTSVGLERNNLVIDAGDRQVLFNANIGTTQRLNLLTLERAGGGVVFGAADVATTGGFGPLTTIQTDGAIDIGAGTNTDNVIGGAGIVFNAAGGDFTVQTSDDNVRLNGAVHLQSHLRIDTDEGAAGSSVLSTAGNITFTSDAPINSQDGTLAAPLSTTAERNNLVIDAGDRQVSFNANIGSTQRLNLLTVERAGSGVVFGAADLAVTGGFGPLTTIQTDGAMDIGAGTNADNVIGGAGIVFNAAGGDFTVQTSDDDVRLNGAVRLQSHLRIDTSASVGGDITFTKDATIDSQDGTLAAPLSTTAERNNLVIDAGERQVSFNANIGATQRLNLLSVERAGSGVVFGAADLAVTGGFGPLTAIQTDGAIDIGAHNTIGGTGIVFNAGAGNLTIQTSDDDVRLNGAVWLQGHLRIDTDEGAAGSPSLSTTGNVTFTSDAPINSQNGTVSSTTGVGLERNNLVIDAGDRQVSFNANLGTTQRLNLLSVERAGSGVVFGAADVATIGSFGQVTSVFTDGAIDIGAGTNADNVIGGAGIVFNAAGGDFTVQTSDDDVRLSGAVWLQSHLLIDTDEGAAGSPSLSTAGNITFTSDAPINSQNGTVASTTSVGLERNNLVIDAGDRQVSFNANIGVTQRLNLLTVERAGSGAVFGAADVATTGDFGPLTTIQTDGAIDIGAGTNADNVIGGAGIVFNAASGDFTVQTSDDDVRLNGTVWLQGHLRIDTDEGAAGSPSFGITGNITFTSDAPISSQNGTVASTTGVGLERNNLVIDAGDRQVSFNANIGATQRLNLLTVERADGGVTFGAGDAVVTGGQGPVTSVFADGAIDIGAHNTIGGTGIVFNAGAGNLTIQTSDDDVRLNGAVWLQGHLRIDTDGGAAGSPSPGTNGNVTFTSDAPINSQNGTVATSTSVGLERNNLVIDAGDRQVLFNANIGTTQRLNLLTLERAGGGVVFGAADVATTGGFGPLTTIQTDGAIDIGAGTNTDNVIGGAGIVFNAAGGDFTVQTSDDDVRLNGAVTLASDTRIDTGLGIGDLLFTNDSPIDSQNGETNDLVINTGTGAALFNENIGESQRLRSLVVESASRVVFGEGDADTIGAGSAGPVNQVNTIDIIHIGSQSVITSGIVLNGGPSNTISINTTGDKITINGATILNSNASLDTDSTDTGAEGGEVEFTSAATVDSGSNESNNLTIDPGSADIVFNAAVGQQSPLNHLTISEANDVTFVSTLQTAGNVSQNGGTGTTIFNGVSGTGIGGDLSVTTNIVTFVTSDIVTVGHVTVTALNTILFADNAGLNAGSATIMLAANQDNAGAEGFSQSSTAIIQTTNETDKALQVIVGGTSDAVVSVLQAGESSGAIHVLAGGSIIDNRTGEDANFAAHAAVLIAGAHLGAAADDDLDTAVASLSGGAAAGDIYIDERDNIQLGDDYLDAQNVVQLRNLTAPVGSIFVNSGGSIDILTGTFLQSATGKVSNAPPLLRIGEVNPDDVIVPADPTQEVTGTIGGIQALGDNLELGVNFTITVTWDDGIVNVLNLRNEGELVGLQAGDTLTWIIAEDGTYTFTRTPNPETNPDPRDAINVTIQRTYPLLYLSAVTAPSIVATFIVSNDPQIVLTDASGVNRNETLPSVIETTVSNKEFSRPPVDTRITLPQQAVEVRAAVRTEIVNTLPVQSTRYQDVGLITTETQVEEPILYLVAVGPDGEEGPQVRLSVTDLRNLSALLERLRKAPIPSAMYRLYYQEPGSPAQMVLEFRKTGNTIGDPVREPGRGTNPVDGEAPQQQPIAPPQQGNGQNQPIGHFVPDAPPTRQSQLESALEQAAHQSFTRASRLLRSWLR